MRAKRTAFVAALSLALLAALPASAGASAAHWVPPRQLTWYWQLTGTVNNSYAVAAYDIDGFDNSAAEVSALHAAGKHAICYIDAGTWENWRSDAGSFPQSVLGSSNGWPGEKWLDISKLSVLAPIMTARLQMCAQKGFDAIEPDNIDGYQNSTGFPLTAQNQLSYNEWIANEAHALGLAVFQKNDPDQSSTLQPYFDGALDEQCNEYSECSSFQPYLTANKPVLNAEYSPSLYPSFCSADNGSGIMGALYSVSLDGSTYKPCFSLNFSGGPLPPGGSPSPGTSSAPSDNPPGGSTSHARPGGRHLSVRVAVGRLIDRRGRVAVTLSCSSGRFYCDGTVELIRRRGSNKRTLVLGQTRFHLTRGSRTTVEIRLPTQALHSLGTVRFVRVLVEVSARDGASRKASSRRLVTLNLPTRRLH